MQGRFEKTAQYIIEAICMVRSFKRDVLVTGFALFAMFFGAGNLIFPPFLGWSCGTNWIAGIACFIIVDVGLSLLVLFVLADKGRGAQGITEDLGPKASALVLSANVICIGPLIAIPRTAATTFELAVLPLYPAASSWIFSIIYFALVILLCLRQTKAMDIIGALLAPVLFVGLLVLIGKGVASPLGAVTTSSSLSAAAKEGILSGYQTMDMMAAVVFASALIVTIAAKGYKEPGEQFKIIAGAGLISGAALLTVYGGLAYLGATMCARTGLLDRATLLITITRGLLGENGIALLGVVVAFACLTTAIGLVSSAASYFADAFNNRLSYRWLVVLFSVLSCVLSNMGLGGIIAFAAPILDLLYPILLVVSLLGLFHRRIKNRMVCILPTAAAFIVSLAALAEKTLNVDLYVRLLPLSSLGLAWTVPALIFGAAGAVLFNRK